MGNSGTTDRLDLFVAHRSLLFTVAYEMIRPAQHLPWAAPGGAAALGQEGLLVSKRNRGVFVVDLTARDVDEIYSVREILELRAAEIIIAQSADRRKEVSERLLEVAAKLAEAAAGDDWHAVSKLDLEFHSTLVAESGNSRLLRAYTTLATESLICMTNLKQAYPAPASLTHPAVMAELIATGSMSEIRKEFHSHLSVYRAAQI